MRSFPQFLLSSISLFLLSSITATLSARSLPIKATPAQTEQWKQQGRDLPPAELLQPSLDAALPRFIPAQRASLSGHLKGAASDVLADLTKQWV